MATPTRSKPVKASKATPIKVSDGQIRDRISKALSQAQAPGMIVDGLVASRWCSRSRGESLLAEVLASQDPGDTHMVAVRSGMSRSLVEIDEVIERARANGDGRQEARMLALRSKILRDLLTWSQVSMVVGVASSATATDEEKLAALRALWGAQ